MVQAQNRDRAATDSAAMAEARIVEDRENGSKLRRHFLLKKPNDDTEETMAGKLFRTDATTVRKLYDDVVNRLNAYLIEQDCKLLSIEHEVRIRGKPSVWVCLWDARDPDCDKEIPPEFIRDDTNLYFVVQKRHDERLHDSTRYDNTS